MERTPRRLFVLSVLLTGLLALPAFGADHSPGYSVLSEIVDWLDDLVDSVMDSPCAADTAPIDSSGGSDDPTDEFGPELDPTG